MPDDDTKNNFHSFDREPPTGNEQHPDITEHADLNHRIEADSPEKQDLVTNPVTDADLAGTPAPVTPAAAVTTTELPKPGPGLMVLQWLVYAFWGWTVLSVSVLVLIIVDQMLNQVAGDFGRSYWFGESVAYPLAAAIVLFFIALICDIFYARAERQHARSNGTNVIMIIHAVLFALFGIGALIISVFGVVNLLIGESTQGNGAVVNIVSGLIIAVIYGMTLFRTLRPARVKKAALIYWVFMTITIIATVILGIIGPAANARLRAQDQIIENELPVLARVINEYTQTNGALPKDLNAVTIFSGAEDESFATITSKNLVEYKPGEKLATTDSSKTNELQRLGVDQLGGTVQSIYHYQLCVTYKTAYGDGGTYNYDQTLNGEQRYDTSVDTYGHKAGNKCYDVQTDYQY